MRQRIVESAMEQIERYGFRKFTIDEIARDLGISKKTVYKHFVSKSDLISAVVDSFLDWAREKHLEALKVEGGVLAQLNAFVINPSHDEVPTWLVAELQQYLPEEWKKISLFKQFNRDQIVKLLEQGIQQGLFRSDIHPALIELIYENAIETIFDCSFVVKHDLTLNQALEMFQTIIYHGIKSNLDSEVSKR